MAYRVVTEGKKGRNGEQGLETVARYNFHF